MRQEPRPEEPDEAIPIDDEDEGPIWDEPWEGSLYTLDEAPEFSER